MQVAGIHVRYAIRHLHHDMEFADCITRCTLYHQRGVVVSLCCFCTEYFLPMEDEGEFGGQQRGVGPENSLFCHRQS